MHELEVKFSQEYKYTNYTVLGYDTVRDHCFMTKFQRNMLSPSLTWV